MSENFEHQRQQQTDIGSPIQPRPAVRKPRIANKPQAFEPDQQQPSKPKRHIGNRVTDVFAVLLLLAGSVGLYMTIQNNNDVKRQVETVSADDGSESDSSGESSSSERPPSVDRPADRDVYDYYVPDNLPRFLTVDSIDVFARIMHIGRDTNGNVGAPTNIHDTSWYTSSSLPGLEDRGSTVITGHVGRDRYNGVFYALPQVQINDTITITMGDNSELNYRVTKTERVAISDIRMGDYLSYAGTDKPQLHLITCVGVYDSEILSYTDRFIVSAEKIQ